MYKALQSSHDVDDDDSTQMLDFNTTSKLQNLKAARVLATEITESGAKLFDMLGREKELKQARDNAIGFLESISRNLDSNSE